MRTIIKNSEEWNEQMIQIKKLAVIVSLSIMLPAVMCACSQTDNAQSKTSDNGTGNISSEDTEEKYEDRSKMNFYITYPDYNTKAFTISYDDGTIQDKKIMSLARKYGVGVTFAPNTAWWGSSGWMEHEGYTVWVQRPTKEEIATFYNGFEIASHTATHVMLAEVDDATILREVKEDMDYMEKLTGQRAIGMCYPGNSYNEHVMEVLQSYGIIYGRSAASVYKFELPENFMEWFPTCHDAYPGMNELVEKFLNKKSHTLLCYYVWGHAYELDKPSLIEGTTRWENLENLFRTMGTSGTVWCATNGQIASYVLAARECEKTEEYFYNRSDSVIYAMHGDYKLEIAPGSKYFFKDGSIEND